MTKIELQEEILKMFHSEFYVSGLFSFIDDYNIKEIGAFGAESMEESVLEMLDELAEETIKLMETEGILKQKGNKQKEEV